MNLAVLSEAASSEPESRRPEWEGILKGWTVIRVEKDRIIMKRNPVINHKNPEKVKLIQIKPRPKVRKPGRPRLEDDPRYVQFY